MVLTRSSECTVYVSDSARALLFHSCVCFSCSAAGLCSSERVWAGGKVTELAFCAEWACSNRDSFSVTHAFTVSCTKCFFLENLAQNHHKQLFAVDSLGAVSKLPVCSASLETQVTLIWSETEHFYRKWTWDVAQSIAVALLICTPYESPPGYTEVLFTFMLTRQFSLGSLHD